MSGLHRWNSHSPHYPTTWNGGCGSWRPACRLFSRRTHRRSITVRFRTQRRSRTTRRWRRDDYLRASRTSRRTTCLGTSRGDVVQSLLVHIGSSSRIGSTSPNVRPWESCPRWSTGRRTGSQKVDLNAMTGVRLRRNPNLRAAPRLQLTIRQSLVFELPKSAPRPLRVRAFESPAA